MSFSLINSRISSANAIHSGVVISSFQFVKFWIASFIQFTPIVEKWFLNDGRYLFVNGYSHESSHFAISFLLISRDVFARFIRWRTWFLNPSLSHLKLYQILGRLIVTTQIEPVISAEPNNHPHLFSNTVRSSCNLQHIDLTAHGLYAFGFGTFTIFQFSSFCVLNWDPTKFWKYGIQYLAVISNNASTFGPSQLKSSVILYVGIGNVNTAPFASHSV